jgi:branched-chain amino acid transport system substrate-binding protein
MRADDHTLINYANGWGQTISKEPFLPEVAEADWKMILEHEAAWKKKSGYL